MTVRGRQNRLDEAHSPYLRQHADNPVNWQPWDGAALEEARERDDPIFLSVGYAACHWCHVMAEESFEDEAIAAVLNEHYVPIKVDREERPDIDRIYQTICQLVTRGGGWPLSVWLTPDGRPFYVGTYFPPEPGRGRPGFRDLLDGLAEAWESDRDEIERRADEWIAAIEGEVGSVARPDTGRMPGDDTLERAADAAVRSADPDHGGFGTEGPKFPQPGRIHLLLRAYDRTGTPRYRDVAIRALEAMVTGGLYDHVGGGFHRYTTDPSWTVPHFEKMLYDNAEIPRALLAGYQVTGDEGYASRVRETLAFVDRELTHPDGGFYSTLDAQSERSDRQVEGGFYVWTPEEIRDAVEAPDLADLVIDRFGVTPEGNFDGRTVLTIERSIDELADAHGRPPAEIEAALADARDRLFDAQRSRPKPARDEKVIAGWNGLMISTFAEAAIALDDRYAGPASDALDFIADQLWDGERVHRRFMDGDVGVDGYLDDYAYLARAALDTYQATGRLDPLELALDLGEAIEREFWDAEAGAVYFTPLSGESLAVRPQEVADRSTPASAGVAIETLCGLDHFVGHDRFAGIVETAIETYSSRIEGSPLEHAALVLAVDRFTAGSQELTVVADELPPAWRDRIGETYLPRRLLSRRPLAIEEWLDRLGLPDAPPIWADRGQRDGAPTVYACEGFACSPPRTAIDTALAWFDSEERSTGDG